MNKKFLYISIAGIVGLLAGYLIFGKPVDESTASKDVSEVSNTHDHSGETANQMWTCSMHPQIMQPEPGDCPICGMELIPAESGADGLSANEIKMTKNAMALANIQTNVVGNAVGENGNVTSLSGKIVENEEASAVQASYFDGRIERLNVNYEGQEVRKGQLLATIYSPNLVAAQQELITTASLKESQPALYKSVRNKLKLWKLSESQINSIEESGEVRENFPIYATVSGTVSEKMAEEGDYVKQGQPILKLNNLNTVWAEFDAYENQISQFEKGQEIKMTTNAYPNKEFDAKISFIDPVLNTQTRIVTVRATIQNKNNLLKPGMFVTGKFEGIEPSGEEQLLVPASAVMWTGERSLVYVKTDPDEPIFEMREVTIGNRNGETYSITSGLEDGDVIVTNGTFTVDAAAQLSGKKSMMNQEGGKTMTGHEGHTGMQQANTEATGNSIDHTKMNERIDVPAKFQKQVEQVFDGYIDLKNALVNDNAKNAQQAAERVEKSLSKVDMKLLEDEKAHKHWMAIQKELKSSTDAISLSSDIKKQRDHFKHLSAHMISSVQLFGVNQKAYSQFCPMANSNKGAYWLSLEKEIQNPYYGQAMLTCGEVRDTFE
ncbi:MULTISPECIES: efflux RND transporter periplasmic adaptor subunit [Mesonia]|uniref:Cation efflux system protein CusB n=1 Tax=Mesonia oceanica TaxID=2687242 RepID=A0AC61Y4D8_9FLAO|nr:MULTISPECIES: efflux RND transporter periplasmic adaptor subunit [Mesonia]MAN29523.1 efflux transporter periplasmic adaptor subunit [Mesonia sp.]MAQ41659.1 efflux transporter periplasmic adaptor subunit [Mesonia sp.]MBJ98710.1 efflux transporter periplasmic adaptor subunit [Flavobacteriaceae bacterium]VVU99356.1 Cation efflux system protein CusB [Mesonia oceanica]|tara:strand:- start:12552 stop:14366 length:1815 start_codon:yes stop_codon:yes gene_type:complete